MQLSELVADLPHRLLGPAVDPEVRAITHDSRRVSPGTLFAAFQGQAADGRRFLPEAVSRGAVAALGDEPAPEALPVPYVAVANARRAAGLAASRLAGQPSERLTMVGITGTSGKTTTSLLVDALLDVRHRRHGLFGTLVYRGAGAELVASRTTPESTDLQAMLGELADGGGTAAVMECSSHALDQERLAGCSFDVAAFLNLSREHLDWHRTMESYFEAKARLFELLKPAGLAVVNADDAWGQKLLPRLPRGRAVGFGFAGGVEVFAEARCEPESTVLEVTSGLSGERYQIVSPLLGRPNAENLLAAAAIGEALGLDGREIAGALGSVSHVPGRLEPVPNALGLTVLVDYAHKPGALEGVLRTGRALAASRRGRLLVVFGCGGDRDKGKRPEMGRIAVELADETIVTSDNPRTEDPRRILDEVRAGIEPTGRPASYLVDRRQAIAEALGRARRGDVILIAGKGHETYQEVHGVKSPFDDRVVARELLAELEARG